MNIVDAGPFSTLVSDLAREGFLTIAYEVDPARFGNVLLLIRRGGTRIRVVKDRSLWYLEIAGPDADDWFSPVVWLAMLDDELPPVQPLSDEEQVGLVRARLAEIDHASLDESGKTLELLKSWQARRAAARRAQSPRS